MTKDATVGGSRVAHTAWRGKRVLVTGASGFLGRHVLALLAERGAHVTAQSRWARESTPFVAWRMVDLRDRVAVEQLMRDVQPKIIFHMSSLCDGSRNMNLVAPIFEAEVVAALNVMLVASAQPIERLIMCGSLEEPEKGNPPSSPYAAAKAASRLYAEMFCLLYKTPIVNTRIFMSYGPGQPLWKFIPYAIDSLARNEPLRVASPDRRVDWIYAADVAEGLLAAAVAPGLEGRSVDIGSGRLVAIREVLGYLRSIIAPEASLDLDLVTPRPFEETKVSDVAKTKRLTGWEAHTSLEEGLRRTYAAFPWAARPASSSPALSRRVVGKARGRRAVNSLALGMLEASWLMPMAGC